MIEFPTNLILSGLPDLAARATDPRWLVFDRATGEPVMIRCSVCSEQYRHIS
ncbi:MAG: hypothetical protein WAK82_43320 [Streptosporangiaceae bacterium]